MGLQKSAVVVGFSCLHIALFCSILTLNSTHVVTRCPDSTGVSNYTHPLTTEVYWYVCTCEGCSLRNEQEGLQYSHVMFFAGTGVLTITFMGTYFFLLLQCLHSSVEISIIAFVTVLASTLCFIASQVLYHIYSDPVVSKTVVTSVVNWPFYTSLAVIVVTTVASLASLQRSVLLCTRKGGYSDFKEDSDQ